MTPMPAPGLKVDLEARSNRRSRLSNRRSIFLSRAQPVVWTTRHDRPTCVLCAALFELVGWLTRTVVLLSFLDPIPWSGLNSRPWGRCTRASGAHPQPDIGRSDDRRSRSPPVPLNVGAGPYIGAVTFVSAGTSSSRRGSPEREAELVVSLIASGLVRMRGWRSVSERERPRCEPPTCPPPPGTRKRG
jgi:hypothetical protein